MIGMLILGCFFNCDWNTHILCVDSLTVIYAHAMRAVSLIVIGAHTLRVFLSTLIGAHTMRVVF